ncbi:MAG: choline/ethanolamine kinase family protein [Porticoccus sp.]
MNRVELLLQQTLSDWQSWSASKPVVVGTLQGGLTNHSFLIEAGSLQAVIRINAENSQCLGIDRQREAEILSLLQPMGCVPKIHLMNDQVLVSEFIIGHQWTFDDLKSPANLKKITQLVNEIQKISLPDNLQRRSYIDYCQHYIQQLPESRQVSEKIVIEELICVAEKIDQSSWTPVISHHDLVPENLLEAEQGLFLLDWEYAAYGHPAIDFVRLYGEGYSHPDAEDLLALQKGIDELWSFLQG